VSDHVRLVSATTVKIRSPFLRESKLSPNTSVSGCERFGNDTWLGLVIQMVRP